MTPRSCPPERFPFLLVWDVRAFCEFSFEILKASAVRAHINSPANAGKFQLVQENTRRDIREIPRRRTRLGEFQERTVIEGGLERFGFLIEVIVKDRKSVV